MKLSLNVKPIVKEGISSEETMFIGCAPLVGAVVASVARCVASKDGEPHIQAASAINQESEGN